MGRVPHAPRRADGRRGFLPAHGRTHRRRGDARAVRTAVRRRRACAACARRRRSTASSSRRSSARSPASRRSRADAKAAGVRLACATAGDPDNIAFALGGLAMARLLRRRGRRARRRARQARARPLPARRASASAPLPAECLVFEDAPLGIEAARRAGMRAVAIASTVPADELGARAARHRAGAGLHDAGRAGPRGASSRLIIHRSKPRLMDNTPRPPAPAVDENQIIAERRAKLAALRAQGQAFPNDFRRDALAARPARAIRREDERGARASRHRGRGRRPDAAEARDGQGELRDDPGHDRAASSSTSRGCRRRRGARRVQALGSGRPRRRRPATCSRPAPASFRSR